jgi:DNA-nicking Smr family endonuclease
LEKGMSRKKQPQASPEISPDDAGLWQEVTESVTPLGGRVKAALPKRRRPVIRQRQEEEIDARMVYGGAGGEGPNDGPGQTSITRRHQRRLSKGAAEPDSILDLHGMTRAEAYRGLITHLPRAFERGERLVLVITGKGGKHFSQSGDVPVSQRKRDDFGLEDGVLKSALPDWLRGNDLNPYVAAFSLSADRHGGEGAFYVRLRRHKGGRK